MSSRKVRQTLIMQNYLKILVFMTWKSTNLIEMDQDHQKEDLIEQ